MNQQLVNYIRQQLGANELRDSVMNTLLAQGWKQGDLDAAFLAVEVEQRVAPAAPPAPAAASFSQVFPVAAQTPKRPKFAAEAQSQFKPQAQQPAFEVDKQLNGGGAQSNSLKNILAFVGLGFGLLSLVSFFMPWVGLPLAVAGIILCVVGFFGSKKLFAIIGIGLCVVGLIGFGAKMIMSKPAPVDDGSNVQTTTIPPDTTTTTPPNGTTTTTTPPPNTTTTPTTTPPVANPLLEATAYVDAGGAYSIQPPKGWQAGQGTNNSRSFIIFLSPTPDKNNKGAVVFNENINITSEPNKETSNDAYVQKSKAALQQYLTGYKITQEQNTTVGGQAAKLIGGTFTQNGLQLRSVQLFAFKGTTAYVITGLALTTEWTRDSPAIQAAVNTFKFQ